MADTDNTSNHGRSGHHDRSGQAHAWVQQALADARRALDGFIDDDGAVQAVERVSGMLAAAFAAGHKVLICGNGGSAADAMHFAEELTGRFRGDRPPLPALACTDAGHITCVANDYGYEQVFARWVTAHGQRGDVVIVLSTSGNSSNILAAVEAAKAKQVSTVALLGKSGGKLRGTCDVEWICPGTQADRIQEIHMMILHMLIEGVERRLFPANYRGA